MSRRRQILQPPQPLQPLQWPVSTASISIRAASTLNSNSSSSAVSLGIPFTSLHFERVSMGWPGGPGGRNRGNPVSLPVDKGNGLRRRRGERDDAGPVQLGEDSESLLGHLGL